MSSTSQHRLICAGLLLAFTSALMTGCAEGDPSPPEPPPPSTSEDPSEAEQIVVAIDQSNIINHPLESGTLVLVADRCVGLENELGVMVGLFPRGTEVSTEAEIVTVTLPVGSQADVGDSVQTTGSAFSGDELTYALPADLPAECATEYAIQIAELRHD